MGAETLFAVARGVCTRQVRGGARDSVTRDRILWGLRTKSEAVPRAPSWRNPPPNLSMSPPAGADTGARPPLARGISTPSDHGIGYLRARCRRERAQDARRAFWEAGGRSHGPAGAAELYGRDVARRRVTHSLFPETCEGELCRARSL